MMTNHTELADKIVALGVGRECHHHSGEVRYDLGQLLSQRLTWPLNAEAFVNDPRVAMAMMEKALFKCAHTRGLSFHDIVDNFIERWEPESLPLAINMACAEALSDD